MSDKTHTHIRNTVSNSSSGTGHLCQTIISGNQESVKQDRDGSAGNKEPENRTAPHEQHGAPLAL